MTRNVNIARDLFVAMSDILRAKKGAELNTELDFGDRFLPVAKTDRIAIVMLEAISKDPAGEHLSVREMAQLQSRLTVLLQGFPYEHDNWAFVATASILPEAEKGEYSIKLGQYPLHGLSKPNYLALVALSALMAEYADASKDEVTVALLALGWWFTESLAADQAIAAWEADEHREVPDRESLPHSPTPWRVVETDGQFGIVDAENKRVIQGDRENLAFIAQVVNNREAYEGLEDAFDAFMTTPTKDHDAQLDKLLAIGRARDLIRELRQHGAA